MTDRRTSTPLHPRLTVVVVPGASADGRELGALLAGASSAIDGVALGAAAHRRAAADRELRARDHEATLARLAAERDIATDGREAASAAVAALAARRERIAAGARWCDEEGSSIGALAAALHDAEAELVAAREQAARAHARMEHVGEQRAAAAAVLGDARAELADLDAAQLAEPALRRELEQSVQDLRDAEHGIAGATRRRHEAATAKAAIEAELATVTDDLAAMPDVDGATVDRLRTALAGVTAALTGPPDAAATALGRAIAATDAELARLGVSTIALPDPGAVEAADRALVAAEQALADAKAAVGARREPPLWWHELGALHTEVVDAESKIAGRGRAPRQRYEAALAAERAKLDELGFDSYVDALLSGGRLPGEGARSTCGVPVAEEAVASARAALEAARAHAREVAPVVAVLAERERLVGQVVALLGVDASVDPVPLLREHRSIPRELQLGLLHALGAVGASPDDGTPIDVAGTWLARFDAASDPTRAASLTLTQRTLVAERDRLERELAVTTDAVQRRSEDADTARRAISRLESELHARVHGETDATRRAASAAALRDRIVTLETQLDQARARAEADVTDTAAAAEAATAERDRTRQALLALARHAAKLADEIAPERRPAFDALANPGALGGALRAEADLLTAEMAAAQARLTKADDALRTAVASFDGQRTLAPAGQPTPDDAVFALADLLAAGGRDDVRVVVDPLVTDAPAVTARLLETILHASADRPVVLLTTDHDTLAWAIELPAEDGAVVPVRALVADDRSLTSH